MDSESEIKRLKEENHLLWVNQEKLENEIYMLCQQIDEMNKRQNNMNDIMIKLIQENNNIMTNMNQKTSHKKRKFPYLF